MNYENQSVNSTAIRTTYPPATSALGWLHRIRATWSSPLFPFFGHHEPSVTHDSFALTFATPKLPIIGTRTPAPRIQPCAR